MSSVFADVKSIYVSPRPRTTKLTNQYFESRLGSISTIRSWRTVVKLQELIGAVEADGVP